MGIVWILTLALVLHVYGVCSDGRRFGEGSQRPDKTKKDITPKLIVVTILEAPYMTLKEDSAFLAGNDRFEGYLADILASLASHIGFDYEIRLVLDQKYGYQGPNHTWSGMIGEVHRGDADIAAGAITVTPEGASVVDFSLPFMTFRSTAIISKRRHRGRLNTADDLLRSKFKYGVIEGGSNEALFKSSPKTLYKSMWSRMVSFWPPVFVRNIQEGIQKARRTKFAFILDSPMAEYLIGRRPCDLVSIESLLPVRSYAFAFRKGDKLLQVVDAELTRMKETHVLQNMYLRWWKNECNRRNVSTFPPDRPSTTPLSPWRYATAAFYSSASKSVRWLPLDCLLFTGIIYILCQSRHGAGWVLQLL